MVIIFFFFMFFQIILIRGIMLVKRMYGVLLLMMEIDQCCWTGACWRLHLQSTRAKNILNFIYKLWALAYKCVVMETIMSPPNFRQEECPLVVVVKSDEPDLTMPINITCCAFIMARLCTFSKIYFKYLMLSLLLHLREIEKNVSPVFPLSSPWLKFYFYIFLYFNTLYLKKPLQHYSNSPEFVFIFLWKC